MTLTGVVVQLMELFAVNMKPNAAGDGVAILDAGRKSQLITKTWVLNLMMTKMK